MLYIRVSQLNAPTINTGHRFGLREQPFAKKLKKFTMTLLESVALKYRDKTQVHKLVLPPWRGLRGAIGKTSRAQWRIAYLVSILRLRVSIDQRDIYDFLIRSIALRNAARVRHRKTFCTSTRAPLSRPGIRSTLPRFRSPISCISSWRVNVEHNHPILSLIGLRACVRKRSLTWLRAMHLKLSSEGIWFLSEIWLNLKCFRNVIKIWNKRFIQEMKVNM